MALIEADQVPTTTHLQPLIELIELVGHPERLRVLDRMRDGVTMSPKRYSDETDATLGTIAYHFRRLKAEGLITLTRTARRRGAIEHYYRLTVTGQAILETADRVAGA